MHSRVHFILDHLHGKVLDVGCSACTLHERVREKVPKSNLYGVDIEITEENDHYKRGSAEQLPFPEKMFDCVVAGELIEHLEQPARFVKEAHRVLSPGGVFILTTPNKKSWVNRLVHSYETPIHISLFAPGELKALLEREGFTVEKYTCFPYTQESSEGSRRKGIFFIFRGMMHPLLPRSLQEEMAIVARKK